MATTDLKLDEPGSLPRPGPIGRIVRLAFGLLCLWYVLGLVEVSGRLITLNGDIRPIVWNGVLIGLFLVSYVVNIGFSRAWKKWPALVSAGVFLVVGGIGFLTEGTVETSLLARTIWGWELYVFSHLGTAFVIAAVLGTPGCEMRAIHDLYSRLTGIPTKERYCPIGPTIESTGDYLMNIRPIKTKRDYNRALQRIERLMSEKPGTSENYTAASGSH